MSCRKFARLAADDWRDCEAGERLRKSLIRPQLQRATQGV